MYYFGYYEYNEKPKRVKDINCSSPLRPWFVMVVIFGFIFPFQKRKLSWSDPDDSGKVPNKHEEHQHGEGGKCQAATSLDSLSTCLPGLPKKLRAQVEDTVEPARGSCIVAVKFTDGAGSLSRLSYLCYKRESENRKQPETSPSSPAQDCSVSSTDTVTTIDSP